MTTKIQGTEGINFPDGSVQSTAWVSVKSFGATGDGTTNDTAAIQAAINAVGSNGTVYIPKGIYRCVELNVPAQVCLVGAGPYSTKLRFMPSGDPSVDATRYVIRWTGSYGSIRDLAINGQNPSTGLNSVCNGLYIAPDSGGYHRQLVNCVVQWFAGYNAAAAGGTYGINQNFSAADIQVSGTHQLTGGNAVVVANTLASELTISDCDIGFCDGNGVDYGACNDARITNTNIVNAVRCGLRIGRNNKNIQMSDIKVYLCRRLNPRDFQTVIPYYIDAASPTTDREAAVVLTGAGHIAVNVETQENGGHGFILGTSNAELSLSSLSLFADGNGGNNPALATNDPINIGYRRYGVYAFNFSGTTLKVLGNDFRARIGTQRQSRALHVQSQASRTSYTTITPLVVGSFYRIKAVGVGTDFIPLQYNLTTKSNSVGFVFQCSSATGTPDPATNFGTGGSLEVVNEFSLVEVTCKNQTDQLDGSGIGYNIDGATISGAWNSSHITLGAYHLWIDSSGKLRIKQSSPLSDTDGTVVGTQT